MKEKIRQTILDTIEEYRGEASFNLERLTGLESALWREPVAGFVSASDGEFCDIRKHSNPEHLLPEDMLAGARSVVCGGAAASASPIFPVSSVLPYGKALLYAIYSVIL